MNIVECEANRAVQVVVIRELAFRHGLRQKNNCSLLVFKT